MPRIVSRSRKMEEAARLKHLRHVLGLSQRQIAEEFRVAHAAVCQWENAERTIPGSVLRLMDIYEENLGMIDKPGKDGLKGLKSSWTSRTWHFSKTSATVAGKLGGGSLRRMLASNVRAGEIKAETAKAIGETLAESLGELKGLAMKLGQMASYMDFALPDSTRQELAKLQHNSQPVQAKLVEQIFQEELGQPPQAVFASWSTEPMAAASIGQVHRAQLKDGTEVAVKIQYPGIKQLIEADLTNVKLLDRIAALFFRNQEDGGLVKELRDRILEECDYLSEAQNLLLFRKLYADDKAFLFPRPFMEFTSKRVITTELIKGKSLKDFVSSASTEEKNRAGATLFRWMFQSIFEHGVFNCDPHPGNFIFTSSQVGFVDFGCVKHFGEKFVGLWKAYARAQMEQDRKKFRKLTIKMGYAPIPEKFDFDYHYKMLQTLDEPWSYDAPFRFNSDYVRHTWNVVVADNPNKYNINVPADWLFASRLPWGLYAILSELGSEFNCREIMLRLLYRSDEPRPAPFR